MTVVYFSGTGNSFHAATLIAKGDTEATILPITGLMESGTPVLKAKTLVLVCPVYFYGLPTVVAEFLARVELPNIEYFAAILTAEFPNGQAIGQLARICKKQALKLNSAFYLKMPTNYLIKSSMCGPAEIERTLDRAEKKLAKIRTVILGRKNLLARDSFLYGLIVAADTAQNYWENAYPQFDKKFWSDGNCSSCGLCQKNCPQANIIMEATPRWTGNCSACLKCINICPLRSIQYAESTAGKPRYFNPRVKLADLG